MQVFFYNCCNRAKFTTYVLLKPYGFRDILIKFTYLS